MSTIKDGMDFFIIITFNAYTHMNKHAFTRCLQVPLNTCVHRRFVTFKSELFSSLYIGLAVCT